MIKHADYYANCIRLIEIANLEKEPFYYPMLEYLSLLYYEAITINLYVKKGIYEDNGWRLSSLNSQLLVNGPYILENDN